MTRIARWIALLALPTVLHAGCGHDHDHDAFNLGHACGHMDDRVTLLNGEPDPDADLDAITRTHTLYGVTLGQDPDPEGTTLGHVALTISSAGRYAIFHDRTVDAQLLGPDGAQIPTVDRVSPVAACDLIEQFQIHDLTVGTYTLRLANAAEGTVQVLVERAEGYTPGD